MGEDRTQCAGMTRRGTRCRHAALPGSDVCRQHAPGASAGAAGPFADLFTPEERAALSARDGEGGLDDVIGVLFVAIRRALSNGSPSNVVVRACEAYLRALKEEERLAAEAGGRINPALDAALDRLSEELGLKL